MMNNQKGAIAIITAILLIVFVGFVALSVDIGYLFGARNELQNAADAGALAGARELYNADGTQINTNCNQIAHETALKNLSANSPVEVNWTGGNTGDIQRGHWSWGRGTEPRGFTPSDSETPIFLWGLSDADLDDNLDFINAVQVTTRRDVNPVASFFGKIFGVDSFKQSTTAVGYIGFAGSFAPYDFDQPIAICLESITSTDAEGNLVFECNIGRMINSGSNLATSNTSAWTGFDQTTCNSSGADDIRDLVGSGNPSTIYPGTINAGIGGGQGQSIFQEFYNDWVSSTNKTTSWELTLPVVDCQGANNPTGCLELVGAVTMQVVWIQSQNDPQYNDVPTQMDDWSNNDTDGEARWNSFVDHFQLKNADDSTAPYAQKSIYAKPSCDVAEPTGGTGGQNLGVLARVPVLVK